MASSEPHPEGGFGGVHGEIAIATEVARSEQDAEHREDLSGATAAERPGEQAGERDAQAAGDG